MVLVLTEICVGGGAEDVDEDDANRHDRQDTVARPEDFASKHINGSKDGQSQKGQDWSEGVDVQSQGKGTDVSEGNHVRCSVNDVLQHFTTSDDITCIGTACHTDVAINTA